VKVLVTGTNKGFGLAISESLRGHDVEVVSLNRSDRGEGAGRNYFSDFEDLLKLEEEVAKISTENPDIEAVFLNAGTLGPLGSTSRVGHDEMERVIRVNFTANKVIVDCLLNLSNTRVFLQISSGASERVYEKWAAYGLSKLLLRRLFDYYRAENADRQFIVVSPGPLQTAMNTQIRGLEGLDVPWLEKFKNPSALGSAKEMGDLLVKLFLEGRLASSGQLIDLREC
jgi:NAD(P)-dependent dehydrogenase (short-subunit alcohol dehydrogenase family)